MMEYHTLNSAFYLQKACFVLNFHFYPIEYCSVVKLSYSRRNRSYNRTRMERRRMGRMNLSLTSVVVVVVAGLHSMQW